MEERRGCTPAPLRPQPSRGYHHFYTGKKSTGSSQQALKTFREASLLQNTKRAHRTALSGAAPELRCLEPALAQMEYSPSLLSIPLFSYPSLSSLTLSLSASPEVHRRMAWGSSFRVPRGSGLHARSKGAPISVEGLSVVPKGCPRIPSLV